MKIAFTTTGSGWDSQMEPRFGRTELIAIYDNEKDEFEYIDNSDLTKLAHGVGTKLAQRTIEHQVDLVITGNGPGENAAKIMNKSKSKMYTNAHNCTLQEAYD